MAQAYFSLVTNTGKIKLAQSAAGGAPVVITHFAVGDGNGAETNPTAASVALVREVWRTPVESVVTDPENPSAVLVTAIIPTSAGGWWMREFGVFDAAGAMVAVAKPVSQYKPTALEGQLEDIRYEFQIIIGESANVTLLVDPSLLFATRAWVEARKIPMAQMMRLPWLPVISMTTTAPPAAPTQGDIYLVPAAATGAWAGNIGKIAEWSGSAWSYSSPPDGHGIGLPDGRVFERIAGLYVEFLASRDWVSNRTQLMAKLNRLPWLPVVAVTTTAPPGAPVPGDTYLVPAGATGLWATEVGKIAEWTGSAWSYLNPPDGHGISLPDGRIFERVGGQYIQKLALDVQSGKWSYAVAGGTPNAITASLTPAPLGLTTGATFRLKIAATNTGPVTIDLNGFGPKPLVYNNGSQLRPGDLPLGILDIVVEDDRFTIAGFSPGFVGSALSAEGGRILNFRVWKEAAREVISGPLNPGLVLFTTSFTKAKDSTRLVFESLPSLRLASVSSTTYARARLDGNAATDLLQNHYLITNNGSDNYQAPQLNRFFWDGIAAGPHTLEFRVGQQQVSAGMIVKNPAPADGVGWVTGYTSSWTIYEVEN